MERKHNFFAPYIVLLYIWGWAGITCARWLLQMLKEGVLSFLLDTAEELTGNIVCWLIFIALLLIVFAVMEGLRLMMDKAISMLHTETEGSVEEEVEPLEETEGKLEDETLNTSAILDAAILTNETEEEPVILTVKDEEPEEPAD